MSTTRTRRPIFFVIPCGAEKADHACPARDLYTGTMFRHALEAARTEVDDDHILILSAKHGLVALDQVVAPYNVKMGDAGSVTADDVAGQIDYFGLDQTEFGAEVYALLPKAYFRVLDAALRTRYIHAADVYEADPGIGYQRGTCSSIRRPIAA